MPKNDIPTLGAVARTQAEEAKKKEARSLFASLGALLGFGDSKAAAPEAKMTKHTVTTKRVETTEGDDDAEAEGEGSEPGESESTDGSSDGGDDEGAEAAEGDEKGQSQAKAAAAAMTKANVAYLDAIKGHPQEQSLALMSPARLAREAKRATGAKSLDGAMAGLSRSRTEKAARAEQDIKASAELEARLAKIEQDTRAQEVNAIVARAKSEHRAGATNKGGRATLREHGMTYGPEALQKLVATLPQVARTMEQGALQPGAGSGDIEFGAADPRDALRAAATQGLTAEQAEEFEKLHKDIAKRRAGANGAPTQGRT